MHPFHSNTPLTSSRTLKNATGKNVAFKLESLQPSGSFKLRGIGYLCQQEAMRGANAFVASSGGNAGVAVAYSGMKLNKPTTVFVPKSSHSIYINAIKSFGATVIVSGCNSGEAQVAAVDFAKKMAQTTLLISKEDIEKLKKYFSDKEIAELCAFIAFGTGYARFGAALSVDVKT